MKSKTKKPQTWSGWAVYCTCHGSIATDESDYARVLVYRERPKKPRNPKFVAVRVRIVPINPKKKARRK